jgi:putative redox protein
VIYLDNISSIKNLQAVLSKKIVATGVAENKGELYATELTVNQHKLLSDEPLDVGGKDLAPAPGDFLCMGLASCKAITLRMYVDRKKWKVDSIKVKVNLEKKDEDGNTHHTFFCEIFATGELDEEQKQRLLHISKACPVSKLLSKGSEIVDTLG